MKYLKEEFIKFLLKNKALLFGDYLLKSGRRSPYFFDLGLLNSGRQLTELGRFFAQKIYNEWGSDFDIIFGPAYKGIPLAVATVTALYQDFSLVKRYSANRKEIKGYGERSLFIGKTVKEGERVILVDDVLTTGQTKIEAVNLLRAQCRLEVLGLVIGLDRLEKTETSQSAVREFSQTTGIAVKSLITILDVVQCLTDESIKENINQYLQTYGLVDFKRGEQLV